MNVWDMVALAALFVQLPIPFFWLIVHPLVGHWRKQPKRVYVVVAPVVWATVGVPLFAFRDSLFAAERAPAWAIGLGVFLISADLWMLFRLHREFGGDRLMGRAELSGGSELYTGGTFSIVRHPRYTTMMGAVLGACLMAATLTLWAVVGVWWLLALAAVHMEERELRARFGAAYDDYARRVPRFLPFRIWPRDTDS
jgi:protein-S-isoprenylcysteine O-methyltransferase Ste14